METIRGTSLHGATKAVRRTIGAFDAFSLSMDRFQVTGEVQAFFNDYMIVVEMAYVNEFGRLPCGSSKRSRMVKKRKTVMLKWWAKR